jgi:hypothetical protein
LFNDAGVGKDAAGIAGLDIASRFDMGAAAVSHESARIGSGQETHDSGVVTFLNGCAESAGVVIGMTAADASRRLARRHHDVTRPRPRSPRDDAPTLLVSGPIRAHAFDSISQAVGPFEGTIAVTGSHGGIVAGRAIRVPLSGAFFNDAGGGKEGAGMTRLPLLDAQDTPAATVGHRTARIGDGCDTYRSGVLTHVNVAARRLGIVEAMTAEVAVRILVERLAVTSGKATSARGGA